MDITLVVVRPFGLHAIGDRITAPEVVTDHPRLGSRPRGRRRTCIFDHAHFGALRHADRPARLHQHNCA